MNLIVGEHDGFWLVELRFPWISPHKCLDTCIEFTAFYCTSLHSTALHCTYPLYYGSSNFTSLHFILIWLYLCLQVNNLHIYIYIYNWSRVHKVEGQYLISIHKQIGATKRFIHIKHINSFKQRILFIY